MVGALSKQSADHNEPDPAIESRYEAVFAFVAFQAKFGHTAQVAGRTGRRTWKAWADLRGWVLETPGCAGHQAPDEAQQGVILQAVAVNRLRRGTTNLCYSLQQPIEWLQDEPKNSRGDTHSPSPLLTPL